MNEKEEKTKNAYRLLTGKPEGKSPLERPRRRWVDNIKKDLRNVEWSCVDCIVAASRVSSAA
jgi:hypothetical protein